MDSAGAVYVTDGNIPSNLPGDPAKSRVVKLATDSNTQTVLPFTGLNLPEYVAVDRPWIATPTDSAYLSDTGNNRVVKLGLG